MPHSWRRQNPTNWRQWFVDYIKGWVSWIGKWFPFFLRRRRDGDIEAPPPQTTPEEECLPLPGAPVMKRSLSLFGLFSTDEKLAAVLGQPKDESVTYKKPQKLLERCLVETSRIRRLVFEDFLECDLVELSSVAGCGKRFAKAAGRALRSESCSRLRRSFEYCKEGRSRALLRGALERYVTTGRPYELAASVLRHTSRGSSRASIQALVFAHPPTTVARYCLVEAYYAAVAAAAVSVDAHGTSSSSSNTSRGSSSKTSARDFAMTSWLAVAADQERPLDERFLAVATVVDAADYCLEVRPDRRFLPDALDELQRLLEEESHRADEEDSEDSEDEDEDDENEEFFCRPRLALKMAAVCRTRILVRLGKLIANLAAKGRERDRRRRRQAAMLDEGSSSGRHFNSLAAERTEAAEAEVQATTLSIVQDLLGILDTEYDAAFGDSLVIDTVPHLVKIYQTSVVGGDARAGIADIVRCVAIDLPRFAALFFLLVDRIATKSGRRDDHLASSAQHQIRQQQQQQRDQLIQQPDVMNAVGEDPSSKDDGYMLRTYVALLFVCELCLSSSPRAILRHLDNDDSGDFVSKFLVGYRTVLDVLPSLFVKAHVFANSRQIDDSISVNPYKPAAPRERINHTKPQVTMNKPLSGHSAFQANDLHRFSTHAFALRTHPSAANLLSTLPS